jgi:hypothetical protein
VRRSTEPPTSLRGGKTKTQKRSYVVWPSDAGLNLGGLSWVAFKARIDQPTTRSLVTVRHTPVDQPDQPDAMVDDPQDRVRGPDVASHRLRPQAFLESVEASAL